MADLIHHLLTAHDPSSISFDAFIIALRQITGAGRNGHLLPPLGEGRGLGSGGDGYETQPAIPLALLQFQWTLLAEAGYKPILDHNARTGKPLPQNPPVLCFDPQAGGVTLAQDQNSRDHSWRVRAETIGLLRGIGESEGGQCPPCNAPPETITRANKLLAAYIREIIGHEPPTLRWIFPELRR